MRGKRNQDFFVRFASYKMIKHFLCVASKDLNKLTSMKINLNQYIYRDKDCYHNIIKLMILKYQLLKSAFDSISTRSVFS